MTTTGRLKGMDTVMRNLQREIRNVEGRSMQGLLHAAIHIRRSMEKTAPKIPIDTGNLRASWYVTSYYQRKEPYVIVGFSASYAVFVHENTDADYTSERVRYRNGKKRVYTPRKGAGAKFFEYALKRESKKIIDIIRSKAYIK